MSGKPTHGMNGTPEYKAWQNMKSRCSFKGHEKYIKNYQSRGIKVCDEWVKSFITFYEHVGPRPSDKHSLDRIDNDKGYEPGNVRWATDSEQMANARSTRLLTYDGRTQCAVAWAREMGMGTSTIDHRLNVLMMSDEEAITTPVKKMGRTLTYNGETRTLPEWQKITGISRGTIRSRIDRDGWTIEEALTTSVGSKPK